jgi:hypothetical protein
MYWESLTTAHKMHTMADNELRAAIINALMKQYEFQRRVSTEQDIWQRADDIQDCQIVRGSRSKTLFSQYC